MKVVYDAETDTLTIVFRDAPVEENDELREGIIVDYDKEGHACAIEILDASQAVGDPLNLSYELKARLPRLVGG